MRGFASYVRLADALRVVLSRVKPLGLEVVPFDRAIGRVLAEDVISKVDVPPFDRAAVDGYAVRARSTFRASENKPVRLHVVGSVTIGESTRLRVKEGTAAKIMTGAPIPKGADAVVMVENTEAGDDYIDTRVPLPPGKNVSARGEDVQAGARVLRRGKRLKSHDVGMLVSIGNLNVRVFRRPRVAILATGGELRQPGTRLKAAQITNINSHSLAAAVTSCGGLPRQLGIVPDKTAALRKALLKAARQDLVLVSGGSSVGERDLVPDVIAERGELLFHGVAMRPGGPTAFGVIKNKPIFALAGFPVASLVAFDMLVRPTVHKMQGLPADRGFFRVHARLSRKISSTLGRMDVVRVKLQFGEKGLVAEPIRVTGSGILSSMTNADGFVVVPEDLEGFREGSLVEVELY